MILLKKASKLTTLIGKEKQSGRTVGFVPTMGALHEGHLALIRTSLNAGHFTVCSIFINPTQFNNADDLKNYPVTFEKDIKMLSLAGCDCVFFPSVPEVYPPGYEKKIYDLGSIEHVWEGHYRPGHFQGVCEVMDRLLFLVQPQHLFMGQKDFQQCMVVRKLLTLTGRENQTVLHIEQTVREADGLAMSSRNLRLSPQQRKKAPAIFQALSWMAKHLHEKDMSFLETEAMNRLLAEGFAIDYIGFAEANTLQKPINNKRNVVILAAVFLGNVRLIDNILCNTV